VPAMHHEHLTELSQEPSTSSVLMLRRSSSERPSTPPAAS
jgi:hypothetical protein